MSLEASKRLYNIRDFIIVIVVIAITTFNSILYIIIYRRKMLLQLFIDTLMSWWNSALTDKNSKPNNLKINENAYGESCRSISYNIIKAAKKSIFSIKLWNLKCYNWSKHIYNLIVDRVFNITHFFYSIMLSRLQYYLSITQYIIIYT